MIGGNIIKDKSIYKTNLFSQIINDKLERKKLLRQVNNSQWIWQDSHPMLTKEIWIEDEGEIQVISETEAKSFLIVKKPEIKCEGLLIHETILDLCSHLSLDNHFMQQNLLIALHENVDIGNVSKKIYDLLGQDLSIKELILATSSSTSREILDNFATIKREENKRF